MFSLQQKSAVITGAGSGIGKAIAQTFSQARATVHLVDLNPDALQQTLSDLPAERSFAYPCNVVSQEAVAGITSKILERSGAIDILVNAAGIAHVGKLDTTTEEDFDKVFAVNVKGVYNMMRAVIGPMTARKNGVILNIASIASTVGIPDRFAYSMSKGAVLTMTLSVAKDYIGQGIRCNCVSPARVHTPFVDGFIAKNYPGREAEMFDKLSKTQPIGRMAKPAEIGALALYLCSDEAGFITGCDYPIDGGFIKLNN
ncbi:SDR family NAD(P)-dependent oxidoreductase [Dinghuibacter silviterrae]|uniref:NAD(P)-dependent dehydrogenase (Short-subunit alcohol dehydrogenase family) n=1 Tax=Dinghuibacter silviterrae TaxID=1539049 RepID=A0A4R8DEN6_9BACT|nr:SDR family oxidoreductase [Dinghuibacter silviterrae]TDW95857.1 NAD(P)-dependent dehydrogenase (short-subunit alcohol dehydrogenase family) [Dinghuibacter silviterrae]